MRRKKGVLLAQRVQKALIAGNDFGISMTVLAELFVSVYLGQRRQRNREKLTELLNTLALWPFDRMAAEEFGKIQAEQRAKGRPIPPLDIQIAAVARV